MGFTCQRAPAHLTCRRRSARNGALRVSEECVALPLLLLRLCMLLLWLFLWVMTWGVCVCVYYMFVYTLSRENATNPKRHPTHQQVAKHEVHEVHEARSLTRQIGTTPLADVIALAFSKTANTLMRDIYHIHIVYSGGCTIVSLRLRALPMSLAKNTPAKPATHTQKKTRTRRRRKCEIDCCDVVAIARYFNRHCAINGIVYL